MKCITTVNNLVSMGGVSGNSIVKITTTDVGANLPSALINQCIRDAKSIIKKHYKVCHKTILKNRKFVKSGSNIRTKAPNLPMLKNPLSLDMRSVKLKGDKDNDHDI